MAATRVIAARYELGERLGVGGMSTVQEGFDRRLERHVAVKLLAEHLADDQQFVSRFKREALSAARLVHPNIVQVFDFGFDEESGRHYIVMEVVRGQSGAELLRERGRLPVGEALDLVGQSCRGLDYAHRNGVVHRDVKPGNLLRSDDGTVKLADFGIAKALHEESSITQVGSVLGTASYLAPEQARGDEAGPAADLYALGVVTYQLLSGRLPYEAQSLTELALKQQREAPAYLHELDPAIPEALSVAVDRSLSLEPGDRPRDAAAMKELLEEGARGHGPGVDEAPDTGATRVVPAGDRTGATRVAASVPTPPAVAAREPTADRPAARVPRPPREPRPEPYHQPVEVYAPRDERPSRRDRKDAARAQKPRRRGRIRRFLVTLLILLLLGVGVAVAVVSTSSDQAAVKLRSVTAKKVDGMVRQIEGLIEDNTR